MKRFSELCADLERTARPNVMRAMIDQYAASQSKETVDLALSLIDGSLSLRAMRPREVATMITTHVALPSWLIDQSRTLGGTLAETAVLLLSRSTSTCDRPLTSIIELFDNLKGASIQHRCEVVLSLLHECSMWERTVLVRMLVGQRPTRCEIPQEPLSHTETTERFMITTMLYAHKAQSIGEQMYSHFTVGVKKGDVYVPLAKIPNTLNAETNSAVEKLATQRTVEKFGPTHWVSAGIIVEIAYTDVVPSTRTKSGIKLQGARIVRWLPDHTAVDVALLL
ncbi:MAG: hypothetical protein NTX15_01160 [Candidatus Kapabacteria bacterium]|nr:hypothetical protein [Candidatus Kapabacteria bacterium]